MAGFVAAGYGVAIVIPIFIRYNIMTSDRILIADPIEQRYFPGHVTAGPGSTL